MSKLILKDENGKQYQVVSQDELDEKVNVDRSLYLLHQNIPLTNAQLFNTDDTQGRLQVIHQRVAQTGSDTFGNYDNLLMFGGDNITSVLNMNLSNSQMKVSIGDSTGTPKWSEYVAWKSDIDALKQEISDLKKQIGGVTRHLHARLIDILATSTKMEVA